ncbi:type II secretion system F family protein [Rossellomorea vietnamensis]|uniref:type II secretion system F family protein n=1 Tax=Rossellomorea vietnamensis TaxID=218284 RepID=UPI001CCF1423|nr:type II secretion system F family protein [Rossellomorea vietnamensis]MCA0150482.1 type II secretion system F family protein [Rossellomorea vietnamensis]
MSIVFLLMSICSFTCLSAAILLTLNKKRIAVDHRINHYFNHIHQVESDEKVIRKKRTQHPFSPLWNRGLQLMSRKTSKAKQKKLNHLIRDAGYSGRLTALEFRLIQLLLSIGGGVAVFFLFAPIANNMMMTMLLAFGVFFLGLQYCTFYLSKKRTRRIAEINREMPDFFDTVNLLIEAGLGLDAAILTVCQKKKGPLSEEFLFVLEDMKRGKSRREAFYELRMRVPSDSLQSTLTTMIQADYLGVGMSKVIRNLTIRIREQRRESAREQAMKAPVKMLFPMVFFIFPSIFIVSLGPLIVKILTEGLM